jgi:FPC/CPF motif-containing protein YcgG
MGILHSVINRSRTIMLKSQQGMANQELELAETSAIKMADQAMQVNRLLAEYTTVQDDTSARTLLLSGI